MADIKAVAGQELRQFCCVNDSTARGWPIKQQADDGNFLNALAMSFRQLRYSISFEQPTVKPPCGGCGIEDRVIQV